MTERDRLIIRAAAFVEAACMLDGRADEHRGTKGGKSVSAALTLAADQLRDRAVAVRKQADTPEQSR